MQVLDGPGRAVATLELLVEPNWCDEAWSTRYQMSHTREQDTMLRPAKNKVVSDWTELGSHLVCLS